MTKQSRKELLKREDAFTEAAEQGAAWAADHRKTLLMGLGALLLAVLGVWGATSYLHHRDQQASVVFAEGWKILDTGVVDDPNAKALEAKSKKPTDKDAEADADAPHFAHEKEKWTAARDKFAAVVDQAGYRGVGAMAALLVGDLQARLQDNDKALATFTELRQHIDPADHLYFLAAERLAYLREAGNDHDGALEALNNLAGDDKNFYADYAQVHQARIYLAKSDKERARTMLEHVEKSFPNSSLLEDVRAQLKELGGAAPDAPGGAQP